MRKQLCPNLYLTLPAIQIICFTAINILGCLIGHDILKLIGLISTNSKNNSISQAAIGSVIGMSACSMGALAYVLFSQPNIEKRLSEVANYTFSLTAINTLLSFFLPGIIAYLIFNKSLVDSGIESLGTGIGTTAITIALFITYCFAKITKNCCANQTIVHPAQPNEAYAVNMPASQ